MLRTAILAAFTTITMISAAAPPAAARQHDIGGIEHTRLVETLPLTGKLYHVQGVDLDRDHIWVTSVDIWKRRGYLHEFDRATGALLRRIDLTDGPRYHPGGVSIVNGAIWVPVAEYQSHSSAVLEEIDTATLQVRRKIRVADHIGCVAASEGRLVAGNWDARRLYIFDLTAGAPARVVRNPSSTRYQDMKFMDGQLVAGGARNRHSGSIDWIDYPSMTLVRSLRSGTTRGAAPSGHGHLYTAEGMALQGRDLYVLPEDGATRLFHFRLDDPIDAGSPLHLTTAALK